MWLHGLSKREKQNKFVVPYCTFSHLHTQVREKLKSKKSRVYLVHDFKHMFLVYKQYYMYFHILFHPHMFSKKLKTVI